MDQLRRDVVDSTLLPNEILIVTPFVKNNPLMDELQTSVHEFWCKTLKDEEFIKHLNKRA